MRPVNTLLGGFLIALALAHQAIGHDLLDYFPETFEHREDVARILKEDNSQYDGFASDADVWFGELILKDKKKSMWRKPLDPLFLAMDNHNPDCSSKFLSLIFEFMKYVERDYSRKAARYARHVAKRKFQSCASQLSRQRLESPEDMFEWTMRQFFGHLALHLRPEVETYPLEDFKFERIDNPVEVCKLASAFNKLRRTYSDYWSYGGGVLKLRDLLGGTQAIGCEREVPEFFEVTCNSDRGEVSQERQLGLEFLNSAMALGFSPRYSISPRTQAFNEYKRICNTFPKLRQTIEDQMRAVSTNKE